MKGTERSGRCLKGTKLFPKGQVCQFTAHLLVWCVQEEGGETSMALRGELASSRAEAVGLARQLREAEAELARQAAAAAGAVSDLQRWYGGQQVVGAALRARLDPGLMTDCVGFVSVNRCEGGGVWRGGLCVEGC